MKVKVRCSKSKLCPFCDQPGSSEHGTSQQEHWSGWPFPSPGIFLTQGRNPGLPHCRQLLHWLSHQGSWAKRLYKETNKNIERITLYKKSGQCLPSSESDGKINWSGLKEICLQSTGNVVSWPGSHMGGLCCDKLLPYTTVYCTFLHEYCISQLTCFKIKGDRSWETTLIF